MVASETWSEMKQVSGATFWALTLTACGAGEIKTTPGLSVDSVRVVEELRIGTLGGADEYLFGRITGVEATTDGSIFVYDAQLSAIRMYDKFGSFVRTVAVSGEGPGEVRQVTGLDLTPSGNLAVWDPANQRVSLFSPSGDFLFSHRVQVGLSAPNSFVVDRSGNFHIKSIIPTKRKQAFDWEFEWVKVSPNGVVFDTLAVPPRNHSPRERFGILGADGMRWPFTVVTHHTINRDGHVVSGRNAEYDLRVSREAGDEPFYSRPVPSIELGAEEHAFWEATRAIFEARGDIVYQRTPETKPVFRDLSVDNDGRLWVDRYVRAVYLPDESDATARAPGRPAYEWREPGTFDVILDDGSWWATISMPLSSIPMSSRGNLVWGRVRGEADEHYVVRWRVVPNS